MAITHRRGRPPRAYSPDPTAPTTDSSVIDEEPEEAEQADSAEESEMTEVAEPHETVGFDMVFVDQSEPVVVIEEPFEPEPRGPAAYVRIVGDQVGRYPRGSIVPALAFEYLENLLNLGAVVYDHTAAGEVIAGDPANVRLLADLQQAAAQVIPTAPWATASAANLLGAHYVPLYRSQVVPVPAKTQPVLDPVIDPQVTLSDAGTSSALHPVAR